MLHAPYVSTIIAAPNSEKLRVAPICKQLQCDDVVWLNEGIACDIFHEQEQPAIELHQPADVITQPTANRQKKLLISDMDSTMIEQECIDELADYLGIKDKVASITERAMNGELDFKDALRERVGLLAGLPEAALQEVYDTHISLMPGGTVLVHTMKCHGAYCLLVSGGFSFFTRRVAAALQFDDHSSNALDFVDGKLSGKVVEPILDKEAKVEALLSCCNAQQVDVAEVLAVGDGANDLPMLQMAGLGIAYHAKPVVQQSAHAAINHNDLSALLYVQGYTRNQWVFC